MPTWKEKLTGRMEPQIAEEIDVFETQMALRRTGQIDEKVFAETRLRRGCYGQRYDNGHRHDGIRTLIVCGVATSGCVESTIRDGFMLDYYVVIPEDACGDYDAGRHTATLTKMDLSFGYVVTVDDVAKVWARDARPS